MNLNNWLEERKIAASAYDAEALLEAFLAEMQRGLEGKKSSLEMIPAYLDANGEVVPEKTVGVIDAGGTNLRVCAASFNQDASLQLSHFSKQAMPGRDKEVEPSEFFGVLADALEPLIKQVDQIGFCFSYPAEILPDLDGRLIHWTKEIKIPGLVGERIGSGLLRELENRGFSGRRVAILNDTVAALLAGMAQGQTFSASSYVGFILGTGTNTAYVEQNEKIKKVPGLQNGSQIINVESGGFNGFERGPADIRLDEQSENPGEHLFEKAISGAYLGPLVLELARELMGSGAFSASAEQCIAQAQELSTIHIDNLVAQNGRDTGWLADAAFSDADLDIFRTLFLAVVERAALLTAVNISAAILKSGFGKDPAHPVCVNIDGSTYYKTFGLADQVQAHLKTLLDAHGVHARCIQVEDAPVAGAAIAGLLLG